MFQHIFLICFSVGYISFHLSNILQNFCIIIFLLTHLWNKLSLFLSATCQKYYEWKIFGSSSFLFAYLLKFSFALRTCYWIFLFHYLSAYSLGCMEWRGGEEKLKREIWQAWVYYLSTHNTHRPILLKQLEFYPVLQTLELGRIVWDRLIRYKNQCIKGHLFIE